MGNGDGPFVRPEWAQPQLYDVAIPITLGARKALIVRLHGQIFMGDPDNVSIEVRIDYLDKVEKPWWEDSKPAGIAFWVPFREYSKDELVAAVQEAYQRSVESSLQRKRTEVELTGRLMTRRQELDHTVGLIAVELDTR